MRLEIDGLPDPIVATVTETVSGKPSVVTPVSISLYSLFKDSKHPQWKFPLNLVWDETKVAGQADLQSWLPGRVYTWISTPHSLTVTPSGGLTGAFYETNFSTVAGQGDTRDTGSVSFPTVATASNTTVSLQFAGPINLVAKLYRNAQDTAPLATFNAPAFLGVSGTGSTQSASAANYQFGFIFRLFESGHVTTGNKGAWLADPAAVDVRNPALPATAFRLDPTKANDPAQYQTSLNFNDPKYLLDRTQGSTPSFSYNEDVPVFELPRMPLLSVGQLQHLQLAGARPFPIGNSWGSGRQLNGINIDELFDRFYFSGLVSGVTPITANGALLLPNPSLKLLRKPDGTAVTVTDFSNAPAAQSSKYLLQGGAFNVNSTNAIAWAAVLRGVRFPAPQSFAYLDADSTTGTAADTATATVSSNSAQFFRFSQSAQETFKAQAGNSGGSAKTELFRQGMTTLTAAQVAALAKAIGAAVATHQLTSGPFRTLEEFLNPASAGAPSLLEDAIATAGINTAVTEFSSQFLTQADIMTALAPVLFARSDTFLIRAYGDAVNPTLSTTAAPAIEGRAWCEALVQRVPEYLDAKSQQPEETPAGLNVTYGRRFKIVSFRWLTKNDL